MSLSPPAILQGAVHCPECGSLRISYPTEFATLSCQRSGYSSGWFFISSNTRRTAKTATAF